MVFNSEQISVPMSTKSNWILAESLVVWTCSFELEQIIVQIMMPCLNVCGPNTAEIREKWS